MPSVLTRLAGPAARARVYLPVTPGLDPGIQAASNHAPAPTLTGTTTPSAVCPALALVALALAGQPAHAADDWSIRFTQATHPATGATVNCRGTNPCTDVIPLVVNDRPELVRVLAWIDGRVVRISFAGEEQAPPIRFENGVGRPWKIALNGRGHGHQSFGITEAFDQDTTFNQLRRDDLVLRRQPRLGTVQVIVTAPGR